MLKTKIIAILLLTVLIGGTAYAVYSKNKSNADTTSRTDPAQSTKEASDKAPEDTKSEAETQKTPEVPKDNQDTNEADQRAQQESASTGVNTTTIKIVDNYQTDSELGIRLDIGRLKSGSCSVSAKKGAKTVTKEAKIALVTSYYACQGFSIPLRELSAGKWTITASASSGGQSYKSAPVEVTVK